MTDSKPPQTFEEVQELVDPARRLPELLRRVWDFGVASQQAEIQRLNQSWLCGKCEGANVPKHSPRCPARKVEDRYEAVVEAAHIADDAYWAAVRVADEPLAIEAADEARGLAMDRLHAALATLEEK